tara:strand:+ start:152 stop:988 length:837 start_codon:yes stop_codon:yes gene_type:complete
MKIFKSTIKKIIFLLKSIFFLDKVNKREINGKIGNFTYLKFFNKTQLKVPFSLGRSARGYPFNNKLIKDPNFKIIYNASQNKSFEELRDSFFEILKKESKLSCADIVGLKDNKKLKKYPAWSYVLPWEDIDIKKKFKNYENSQKTNRRKKAKEYNFKHQTKNKNYIYSIEMADSQVNQSIKLFDSISKYGYKPRLNLPTVHILVRNNEWRWYMSQGNHRAYILYLLKYKFLNGTIDSVIYKNKSYLWPNVKNGLFSIKEAEVVFDYLFEAKNTIGPCI